jgi:hypothetical protein
VSINAETLAVLRGVAQNILTDDIKTEVTVMRRQRDVENVYGLSDEEFVEDATYLGWLVSTSATDLKKMQGIAGSTEEFELRLPIEALIAPGDQVVIGGALYTVQVTNNEDTLPMFMEATLRRVE